MKKLRLTIVVAALVVSLPLGLLVSRALRSVEAEKELRHEIVAERVFDEMERELTTFLRSEEERPFEHYRYFYIREDAPDAAALVRSPLADLPAEPFVVGHFQVDFDGRVSTPLVDGDLVPEPVNGWEPSQALYRAVTTLQSVVGRRWRERDEPGVTVESAVHEPEARFHRVDRVVTSSEYLRALNRGARAREHRLSKNQFTSEQNMVPVAEWQIAASGTGVDSPRAVEVFLSTMVGRRVDDEHLLLYRNVSVENAQLRQGLVLRLESLARWLEKRVLTASELRTRSRLFLADESDVPPDSDGWGYRFTHRFAEPFHDIDSVLVLASLPEPRGARYVYLLSALLVMTAVVGLYGLYRMVAAEMAFAEKRQSFVSAVSHELRTPLTAIRMHAEMLRDGAVLEPEKRQQYYEVMTAESERLTRLVNNVLEMSRLERDESPPEPMTGPLPPILEQVLETLAPHARQEGFELRLDLAPGLPHARFDPDGLLQVLFNLVDNAIKYAGSGPRKEIVLRAAAVDDSVEIEVSDFGPGVENAQLQHVFEPFYRGAGDGSRAAKGSGMGLALVRRLVDAMGGAVQGENRDAGGFTVRVRLAAHGRTKK